MSTSHLRRSLFEERQIWLHRDHGRGIIDHKHKKPHKQYDDINAILEQQIAFGICLEFDSTARALALSQVFELFSCV